MAGYVFGLYIFSLAFFWLTGVSWAAFALVVIFEAIYIGLFGLVFYWFYERVGKVFFYTGIIPALWVAVEYVRSIGFLGMPLGLMGYALMPDIALAQAASWGGVYGLSFIVVLMNGILLAGVQRKLPLKQTVLLIAAGMVLIAGIYIGGRLELSRDLNDRYLRVTVIQPDIPTDKKWDEAFLEETVGVHEALSLVALKGADADLVVWPETAVPCFLFYPRRAEILERVTNFARQIKHPLFLGVEDFKRDQTGKHAFNSAVLFSARGELEGTYAKIKLVPFNEQAPFGWMVPSLRKLGLPCVFEPGRRLTVFQTGGVRFSSVICFEALFPGLVRRFVKNGAEAIINITNDASSLGRMRYYYTHNAHMLSMRAIENRRSIVRAANNGLSVLIDPYGRIIKNMPLFKRSWMRGPVMLNDSMTFYTRYGDVLVLLSFILIMGGYCKIKIS